MDYLIIAVIAVMGTYVSKTALSTKVDQCNSAGDYYLVKMYGWCVAALTILTVALWLALR